MTAGAMILGMIPMALGVGEGGEQNAPLARAVIGGLLFATFATLVLVPVMYRTLRRPVLPNPMRGAPHLQRPEHVTQVGQQVGACVRRFRRRAGASRQRATVTTRCRTATGGEPVAGSALWES